jgi:hypothetical protein
VEASRGIYELEKIVLNPLPIPLPGLVVVGHGFE